VKEIHAPVPSLLEHSINLWFAIFARYDIAVAFALGCANSVMLIPLLCVLIARAVVTIVG
jgi:hypothetical protein